MFDLQAEMAEGPIVEIHDQNKNTVSCEHMVTMIQKTSNGNSYISTALQKRSIEII